MSRSQRFGKGFLILAVLGVFVDIWFFGGNEHPAIGLASIFCALCALLCFWDDKT